MESRTPHEEPERAHSIRRPRTRRTPEQRFHALTGPIESDGPPWPDCQLWMGARPGGYGLFWLSGRKMVSAHRFAYELVFGPISAGMQIDHVCRVRRCVNPDHLQVVTSEQNQLLHRIRMGEKHIYVWEEALLQGLAVELEDLARFRRGESFPWSGV